ncbi:putative fimbrial-like adhesin protein [Escherichia coli]|uniref:Putative fimbrial-like adhesin protein n=1 Tax=Escherichia coli TaxID=562 RepID=A0A376YDV6_ECOLX|nr:putative fimbrial-like adhesin protein [Escherichia coli]
MFKGQKTLTALAISLLFTAPVYAADEGSGEIHFKGEVIEAPCEIHQDDIDKEVELGQVTTSHINQSHHSDAVAVDLRLVNCDLENSSNGSGGKILKLQSPLIAQRKPPAQIRFSTTPARVKPPASAYV